jgi:2-polyprenyl-6-methoxyphenol hydroxylase-like FAD-dependent oxidoreductase
VWLAGDAVHQAAPIAVQSMNSGLVEVRELALRISQIQRASASPSVLEQFAGSLHATWESILEPARAIGAHADATPWVKENAARILASLPASGDDVAPLLGQIGLTPANAR